MDHIKVMTPYQQLVFLIRTQKKTAEFNSQAEYDKWFREHFSDGK